MQRKQKLPEILASELYDGEEVVWWGQPIPTRLAFDVNIMNLATSAGLAAFAIFFYTFTQEMFAESAMRSFSVSSRGDGIRSFVQLMFTIVPLFMFLSAAWTIISPLKNYVAGLRTYYLLTNQRAVIVKNLLSKQVQSFYDENVDRLNVNHFGNGVGSIFFATEQITRQVPNKNRTTTVTVKHGFRAIADVRTVEDMMSQIFFNTDKKKK